MPEQPLDEPKRARGNALQRSALDIDRLSVVTDRDIAAARRDWKRRVGDRDKGLIDAKPEEEST
jgi:hypothetical protein